MATALSRIVFHQRIVLVQYSNHAIWTQNSAFIASIVQPASNLQMATALPRIVFHQRIVLVQYSNHAIWTQNSAFIASIVQPASNLHAYIQLHALSKLISAVMWTQ